MNSYTLWERFQQGIGKLSHLLHPGTLVWENEWDVLCVLDACRVDTFQNYHPDTESYWSVASTSRTWLSRTFGDDSFVSVDLNRKRPHIDCSSIGYISANPYSALLDETSFGYFHLEPVSKTDYGIETVAPSTLRDRAVTAWRNRDDLGLDKLIIHYMQPHVPFRSQPDWFSEFHGSDSWGSTIWERLRGDELDRATFFDAYEDNLEWVLEEGVYPLSDLVTGTIGVTADHGNAAGEWGLYGHSSALIAPPVRRVPWMTLEGTDTGKDVAELELETRTLSDDELQEQLAALGYV